MHSVALLKEPSDLNLARLFSDYNSIVKYGNDEKSAYVWDGRTKLWIKYSSSSNWIRYIGRVLLVVLHKSMQAGQIDMQVANKFHERICNQPSLSRVQRSVERRQDNNFLENVDKLDHVIPIADGKKINIKTMIVSNRTIRDCYTYFIKANYLPNLVAENNEFIKFLRSIWTDDAEYNFFRLLNGKFVLPDNHANILVIWHQINGAGGKTIWTNVLCNVLNPRITSLGNEIIYKKRKLNTFKLARLRGKTLAYIDEVSSKDKMNLRLVLDLTGGGYRGEADKYEKEIVSGVRPQTAGLILLGNAINIEVTEALERRVVYLISRQYFREPEHWLYDRNDPRCGTSNNNLINELLNNKDHVFTFLIDAAHDYINLRTGIKSIIPKSIRQNWLEKYSEKPEKRFTLLQDFMGECCVNIKDAIETIEHFVEEWNMHLLRKNIDIVMFKNDINILIKRGFGDPKIKLEFTWENDNSIPIMRNIKLINNNHNNRYNLY